MHSDLQWSWLLMGMSELTRIDQLWLRLAHTWWESRDFLTALDLEATTHDDLTTEHLLVLHHLEVGVLGCGCLFTTSLFKVECELFGTLRLERNLTGTQMLIKVYVVCWRAHKSVIRTFLLPKVDWTDRGQLFHAWGLLILFLSWWFFVPTLGRYRLVLVLRFPDALRHSHRG